MTFCSDSTLSGEPEKSLPFKNAKHQDPRLMTMSPLYPCGKPCSRGTHNETVKNLALFSSIINGIMKESRLPISIPWECFQFCNRIEKFYHIYTLKGLCKVKSLHLHRAEILKISHSNRTCTQSQQRKYHNKIFISPRNNAVSE